MNDNRKSGVLLHITSLPSRFGIGDLGPAAYQFVDFLVESGQHFWQILPLNPTALKSDNSPYHSTSAFAFNPLLISPESLVVEGLLSQDEIDFAPSGRQDMVNYSLVTKHKMSLFQIAYERFKKREDRGEFDKFCSDNNNWLEDFALFVALKEHFTDKKWHTWPQQVRDRVPSALQKLGVALAERVNLEKFLQYTFHRQWCSLGEYCRKNGILVIGDIPIYVTYESADLWTNPQIFKLDEAKKPYAVAGVPPDYFSSTGQLWGNPVYRWDVLKEDNYSWWRRRLEHNLTLFDIVRIDHFRGLVAYWEIPAGEKTAIHGRWVEAAAMDFFTHLKASIFPLPIIAEDLGVITEDVKEVMRHFDFPGMRVLLFAFAGDFPHSSHLPHNLAKNSIVYTGTHDNNTIKGWLRNDASEDEKRNLYHYLGRKTAADGLHWELIRLAMMSVAEVTIIPMQDILGLGAQSRMNRPATYRGNWRWRLLPAQLDPPLARRLRQVTETYGR